MAFVRRPPRPARTWRPFSATGLTPGAVANNVMFTLIDLPITNPSDASVRLSGLCTGGFLDVAVDTGVAKAGELVHYLIEILPQGSSLMTLVTDAAMSTAEPFLWYHGMLDPHPSNDMIGILRLRIQTKRKFQKGYRFVVLGSNQSGAAFAAGSTANLFGELWIVED